MKSLCLTCQTCLLTPPTRYFINRRADGPICTEISVVGDHFCPCILLDSSIGTYRSCYTGKTDARCSMVVAPKSLRRCPGRRPRHGHETTPHQSQFEPPRLRHTSPRPHYESRGHSRNGGLPQALLAATILLSCHTLAALQQSATDGVEDVDVLPRVLLQAWIPCSHLYGPPLLLALQPCDRLGTLWAAVVFASVCAYAAIMQIVSWPSVVHAFNTTRAALLLCTLLFWGTLFLRHGPAQAVRSMWKRDVRWALNPRARPSKTYGGAGGAPRSPSPLSMLRLRWLRSSISGWTAQRPRMRPRPMLRPRPGWA